MDKKDLLRYAQHADPNPIGQGDNLKKLLELREKLTPSSEAPWKPNFDLVGRPYDTPGNFEMVGEAFDPRSKDLVVRGAGEVIPTTGKVISEKPSLLSRFLGGAKAIAASPAAQSIGKFAANPMVQAATMALEPSELDETEDAKMRRINQQMKAQAEMEDPSNLMADIASFGKEPVKVAGAPMSVGQPAEVPDIEEIEEKTDEVQNKLLTSDSPILKSLGRNRDSLRMMEAMLADSRNEMNTGLLRAAIQAGAAIAGVRPDYSVVDALEKNPKEAEKLKTIFQTEDRERQKDEEAQFDDPSSEISKRIRAQMQTIGYPVGENVSASMLKRAGVNLNTLLGFSENQKARQEAAENKKELEKIKAENKQSEKIEKLEEGKKKFAQSLRKEATTGTFGKAYSNYLNTERGTEALETFAKNPTAYTDYGALMLALKTLQGDESVVREAEVRMGMSATSFFNSVQNQIQRAMTGKSLQPQQRKQMTEAAKALRDIAADQYTRAVAPIVQQAEMEEIPTELVLPPTVADRITTKKKEQTTTEQPQQAMPPHGYRVKQGNKVFTWDGSKYVEEK